MNDLYLSRKPLAGFAVIGLAWASYFAQMPVIKENLDVSDAKYGVILLLSALGAVGAMFFAPLTERLAGPFALVIGALAICIGFMWVGVAPGVIGFMLALGLASAGSGIIDVLANARIAGIEAHNLRPLMNLNHAFYSFCYAGAALMTGAAREAGWTPLGVFTVLMVTILLLCFVMYGPDNHAVPEDSAASDGTLPTALVWITGVIVLMAFLTESSTEGWAALHVERSLGGSAGEGAFGPAVLGLTMGIGRLSGYAASKYVPDLILMALACLISAVGIALAAGAATIQMAYVGFALGGLGISVVGPLALALLGRSVPSNVRTLAISRAAVLGYCAFFMGPALMGFVSEEFGLAMSFYAVAALLIVVAGILIPMLAQKLQKRA